MTRSIGDVERRLAPRSATPRAGKRDRRRAPLTRELVLETAVRLADRGGCPLVFPEGERSTDGGMLPFSRGVAILARDLHLPVIPCAAAGLLAVLPKGSRRPKNVWGRRAPVAIRFGEALPAPRAGDDPYPFVEEIRARIGELLEEARGAAGRF